MKAPVLHSLRRLLPVFSAVIFLTFIGCGGGSESPPKPADFTKEEDAALKSALDGVKNAKSALANGGKLDGDDADRFMSVVLQFLTANNGQNKHNGKLKYAYWRIANDIRAQQGSFSSSQQLQIVGQLGKWCRDHVERSPTLATINSNLPRNQQFDCNKLVFGRL